MPPVAW